MVSIGIRVTIPPTSIMKLSIFVSCLAATVANAAYPGDIVQYWYGNSPLFLHTPNTFIGIGKELY